MKQIKSPLKLIKNFEKKNIPLIRRSVAFDGGNVGRIGWVFEHFFLALNIFFIYFSVAGIAPNTTTVEIDIDIDFVYIQKDF